MTANGSVISSERSEFLLSENKSVSTTIVALVLFALSFAIYWPLLSAPPFELHNIVAIDFARTANDFGELTQPDIAPGLRHLTYLTFALEDYIANNGHALRTVNNIVFNALFGLSVFVFLRGHLQDASIATMVALISITGIEDSVSYNIAWSTGRQALLAAMFGLFALSLLNGRTQLAPRHCVALFFLLSLSLLFKEFGVLFCFSAVAYALMFERALVRPVVATCGAVLLIYGSLWWLHASSGVDVYCEDMGYFFRLETICLSGEATNLVQVAYNGVAGTLTAAFPLHAGGSGQTVEAMQPEHDRFSLYAAVLAIWAATLLAAAIWGGRKAGFLFLMVLFNGLTAVIIVRSRNLLPGLAAGTALSMLGFSYLVDRLWRAAGPIAGRGATGGPPTRSAGIPAAAGRVALLFFGTVILAYSAYNASRATAGEVAIRNDPLSHCAYAATFAETSTMATLNDLVAEHGRSWNDC